MLNWKKYNESLVKRGEILLDFDVIDNWDYELEKMNQGKEGRKFVYPDSFIKLLGYMRVTITCSLHMVACITAYGSNSAIITISFSLAPTPLLPSYVKSKNNLS